VRFSIYNTLPLMMRLSPWFFLVFVWLTLGCGRPGARSTSAPSAVVPSASVVPTAKQAPGPPFIVGTAEQVLEAAGLGLLLDVRSARHEGFDRVAFEFAQTRPGYHVEYIDKPVRRCGSGETTAIAGDGWLEVRFYVAEAHTPSGAPTIAKRDQHPGLAIVKQLQQTCDFEGYVTWVIGVSRPNKYRVITLTKPERIVIDIQH
jgi:hypothetical protein